MASAKPHVIMLQTNALSDLVRPAFERQANAGTIKPGHALEMLSTGKVQVNATAGANNVKMVAVEHGFRNPTGTTLNIETAFSANDIVTFIYPQSGDLLYMILKSGANLAAGAKLELATGGEVQALTTGALFGILEEAVDATAAATRAKVRIV
jgi:stage V sporulation protein SpoVS